MDADISLTPTKAQDPEGVPECVGPLHEWPQTDKFTVLMQAVLANSIKCVARMLSNKVYIWNQRGPCGRKPEQVALDLGHFEVHAMLVAKREKAELMEGALELESQRQLRL